MKVKNRQRDGKSKRKAKRHEGLKYKLSRDHRKREENKLQGNTGRNIDGEFSRIRKRCKIIDLKIP